MLSATTMVRLLLVAAGSFVILHFLVILVDRGIGRDAVPGADIWVRIFNLDFETTVPAWWSAVVLILTALLALTLSRVDPLLGVRGGWTWTAAVLAFLSFDESAVVHEEMSAPLITRFDLDPDRWQLWAWLLPYSLLGLGVCVVAVPFLRRLPGPTRRLFIAGAALYVTGAAGMELLGRPLFTHGEPTIAYLTVVAIEEGLEMLGIAVLATAMLRRLRADVGAIELHLR